MINYFKKFNAMTYDEKAALLKKNKFVGGVARFFAYPMFRKWNRITEAGMKRRIKGEFDPIHSWILDYKDKYKGKRCFIVATGPSLTVEDLDLIKDEYSFSMNSVVLILDKTEWRPAFYGLQDGTAYDNFKEYYYKYPNLNILASDGLIGRNPPSNFKFFPLHILDHKMFHLVKKWGKFKFSKDPYIITYDAYSIIFSMMQFACYMGFKEIYLLGCDCNYNDKQKHFIDDDFDAKIKPELAELASLRLIAAHKAFKDFVDKKLGG